MDFRIEKFVSNFVQNQFPLFYQEEGPDFVLFMKAYYEWMEDSWGQDKNGFGGPIRESRELFDYRDIDNTIEKFLEFFQKKYLYGIPFNVISNKRFLLKHILDVYRSKGTIQCYRLLFKLLYNEDIEVYLPGRDVLRVSDGTWVEPKYLEITGTSDFSKYIGRTIIGSESGVTAVVENYVKESYNRDVSHILYISNVTPKKKDFQINEKIVFIEEINDDNAINLSPTLIGSLDSIDVVSGGQDYKIGDLIKIVRNDPNDNSIVSYGVGGILRVTKLSTGFGSLAFDVIKGGTGFTTDAKTFVYRNGLTGQNASFEVGSLTSTQTLTYNTDILCNYTGLQLNAATFGFPANPTGNLTSTFASLLSFSNNTFGTIFSLDVLQAGIGYEQTANTFVRTVTLSKPLQGTISYNSTSNTVTGTGTLFQTVFSNNDVIELQANSSSTTTKESFVIKEVVSNTQLVLYAPPAINSTVSAVYRAAPTTIPSQFAYYEGPAYTTDGSIVGENETVRASPNIGNNVAQEAISIDSGRAYVEGEEIKAYLYSSVSNNIVILDGGRNYSANDSLLFVGGDPAIIANGFVSTVNGNGTITAVTLSSVGSGYKEIPEIRVKSANGYGAIFSVSLNEFNTNSEIIARVKKSGIGKSMGYWTTTKGFLDSDKYIQDSYYYQDYSYEIRVAQILDKYKNIINETFHIAGSEIFGKYLKFISGDLTLNTVDSSFRYEDGRFSADSTIVRSDGGYDYSIIDVETLTDGLGNDLVDGFNNQLYTSFLFGEAGRTNLTADRARSLIYMLVSEINKTSDSSITVDRYYV